MPIESSSDPREALVRRKYFSLRPQPLEQWLWRQGIARSAERVFWLHWQEGMRNRDWCSSIPLKRVASLCSLDISSVTRAYQMLGKLGLIRRQDPGRDPSRPFEQAVALTEVRVPRELLQELAQFPDRKPVTNKPQTEKAPKLIAPLPATEQKAIDPFQGLAGHDRRRALGALQSQLSANERRQYESAILARRPHLAFDADCKLDPQGRAALLQFLQVAAAKPTAAHAVSGPGVPNARIEPRRLMPFELARLRRELLNLGGFGRAGELLREVVWAVEQGALSRFATLHAVRIALKKIRENAWTRPNRMPPNWTRELACPEQCRSA